MKVFIIAIAVIIAVLTILLIVPLRLAFEFSRDDGKNEYVLVLRYMFFKFRLTDNKNKKDKEDKKKEKKKDRKKDKKVESKKAISFEEKKAEIERYIEIFDTIKLDAEKILEYAETKAVIFEEVSINSQFGFDNAMHTGIFTGIYNGFVYSILGFIHQRCTLNKMEVQLNPIFDNPCFNVDFKCILRLKNVHIMVIAANVLRIIRKVRKIEGSK